MKNILLILLSLILLSCGNEKNETIKLHIFNGGDITVNNLEIFAQDSVYRGQNKQFKDAFYVIEHPKGKLMWDAGLPEALVGKEPFNGGAFTVTRKDSLVNQLKKIGLIPNDFKYIALSHTHFDHIGHANHFKNATWLVQENEHQFFTNDSAKVNNADIYNNIKELQKVKKLNGDLDVFGDGTVIIKSMPGHTIGHQCLYLNLGLEQPILLTGDLYHFEENRIHKRVPIFNYNVEQTIKSMEQFETFAKEKNAMVIIQHSPTDFEKLKKILAKK